MIVLIREIFKVKKVKKIVPNDLKSPKNNMSFYFFSTIKGGGCLFQTLSGNFHYFFLFFWTLPLHTDTYSRVFSCPNVCVFCPTQFMSHCLTQLFSELKLDVCQLIVAKKVGQYFIVQWNQRLSWSDQWRVNKQNNAPSSMEN